MAKSSRILAVNGAHGRMGTRIAALASEHDEVAKVVALERGGKIGADGANFSRIDAVIDFSSPDGVGAARSCALEQGCALLVGTTGLPASTLAELEEDARSIPVMVAPNTSLGVAVMRVLVERAASMLGPGFEVDLVDIHHSLKKDAPSGTAKALAASANAGRPDSLPPDRVHALRAGGVVGRHTVRFTSPWEEVVLEHNALTRDVFASGAIRAALWLVGREPGMYGVESVWERDASRRRAGEQENR